MSTRPKYNREGWLSALVEALRPTFKQHGYKIPKYRIACSFPSRRALSKPGSRTVGQCWPQDASAGGVYELLVSPVEDDVITVAGITVHELGHAVLPSGAKHNGVFKGFMKEVGLSGPATATKVEKGSELHRLLSNLTKSLGPYPHQRLNVASLTKPQGTRLLKVKCFGCGYVVRVTRQWLDVGLPTCCCGKQMEEV